MNILYTFIHAVVLWTLVESRNVGRLGRSLDVEGKGSNLTQKQHQGVFQSDVLQHFTTTPPSASEGNNGQSTPSLIKELPFLPEDINIQNLKNDDQLLVTYNRKISVDKENPDADSSQDQNKTQESNTNDELHIKYNKTGFSSSTASEISILHSSYEHSSTSIVYDEDFVDEKTQGSVISSTSKTSNIESEWKDIEEKKKEKGKKEILDSATVPTDSSGAGKVEKPFKDSLLNSKLKDKNKDSISEALDDRRSTTIRISNSSSVSFSDHDNNRLQSSLELPKINLPNTSNKEVVNQSVNSVININGVNNDLLKKPIVKTALKKVTDNSNNSEVHNAAASSVFETSTSPSPVYSTSTPVEKIISHKQYSMLRRSQLNEASPTKVDILPRVTVSSTTTVVKPSIAFKQQLANKLKGLETVPTASLASSDEGEEIQSKSGGKLSTKFILRKKPKLDHVPMPEMNIPPTATAWTLVSLKSSKDTLRSSLENPESSSVIPISTETTSLPNLSTLTPISRVKSFIPWSTRLFRSSTTKPPSTTSVRVENTPATSDLQISSMSKVKNAPLSQETSLNAAQSTTTEEQSIIRTTMELDRSHPETSVNIIQHAPDDLMVKDQSSLSPQHTAKTEISDSTTDLIRQNENGKDTPNTQSSNENESQVVENVIEAKQLQEENESEIKKEEKNLEKPEKNAKNETDVIVNQISQVTVNENANEVKFNRNSDHTSVVLEKNTNTPTLDLESTKIKNITDQFYAGGSDSGVEDPNGDGKSVEESEEDERHNVTTLPPIFELMETTTAIDLDEDVDGESEREEDDFPVMINKTSQVPADTSSNQSDTSMGSKQPGSSDTKDTATYVTSIDIIAKENSTKVVTQKPSEGDINWYNVDTKQNSESVEETSEKPISAEATTTVAVQTTIEPETTTKVTEQETTVLPDNTDSVTTMTPTTTIITTTQHTTTETVRVSGDVNVKKVPDLVEDTSSCVRVIVQTSPASLCLEQQQLRETIAAQLTPHIVSWDQVLISKPQGCDSENLSDKIQNLNVNVCFAGRDELPSPAIRNEFLRRFATTVTDQNLPIINVQTIMDMPMGSDGFDNIFAAIILSVIAAICLVLLGILLLIVRKRQGRFNYGQRCTPVSLDDYSLDNISVYNSVRRKGAHRASKRSYGNPGFDDPAATSHPINFAGLANFSSDRDALDEEFNQIPMITVKPDELPPGAESKNRYANVIPLPETRVLLQTKEGADPLEDYINANYIKGPKSKEKLYIACQAPLQSTIEDFWKMVWQQQTKVILMLTALNENGVEKCADYLPQLEITDCHRMFGDFQVTLKKHEVREKYIISSLQLKNLETNLWREVTHLWYVSWPAQGVPDDCSSMIAFLIEARSYMRGAQGPTVVHCSPGTGRTGTVIAIDLCIRDFETLRSVDIPKTVYSLRRDRAGSVQTKDQYAFIYKVLNLYATKLTGGAMDSI